MSIPMQVRLLYYNLVTPDQRPAILWGWPGTGKTAVTLQLFKFLGWCWAHRTFSDHLPEDLGGQPMYIEGAMRRFPMQWIKDVLFSVSEGQRVAIFCDELTSTPQPTQVPLMRLFHEWQLGDVTFDRKMVKVVAAANPVEMAANGQPIADALANRAQHIDWKPMPTDVWVEYMRTGRSIVYDLPPFDPQAFNDQLPIATAHITSFIEARPQAKDEDPEKVQGRGFGQYASGRTWDFAMRALATCYAFGDRDAMHPAVAGLVGEPVALELFTYLRDMDLPNPELILTGEMTFAPDPERRDRTHAVLAAVVAAAKLDKPNRAERWCNAWRHAVAPSLDSAMGPAVVAARALASSRPQMEIPSDIMKIIGRLTGVSREAGIV